MVFIFGHIYIFPIRVLCIEPLIILTVPLPQDKHCGALLKVSWASKLAPHRLLLTGAAKLLSEV
jgi:hypothetical protein